MTDQGDSLITVGQRIQQLTQKYCKLYDRLQSPDFDFLEDTAATATYDLRIQIYINEQTLEKVKEYINSKKK